jgi:2-amino-4-hydroxy-6-hydroxymethyldihydropteridine diphosphokinase
VTGRRAVLALGANLGDRGAALQSAVDALVAADGVSVAAVSPVVESVPVGGPQQPDYLNAVVLVDTTLTPHELLATCRRIEFALGRERGVRWAARTLDVDIITYADLSCADEDLEIPHPRAARRAFVLAPWSLLDPDAVLPGPDGDPVPVRELLARATDVKGVRPAALVLKVSA